MGTYVQSQLTSGEEVVYEASMHWIIFIGLTGLLTLFIWPILVRMSWEFAATNKKVIWKTGLIRRNTDELRLDKVESVQVQQGFLGRLFNYGTVQIVGTGGTSSSMGPVANPMDLRKAILYQQDVLLNKS